MKSSGIHLTEPFLGIPGSLRHGDVQSFFLADLPEASPVHDRPGGMLQDRMDIGAELHGIHRGLPALLGFQAVLQKIEHPALGEPIDLRSRQPQSPAIQARDVFRLQAAYLIIPAAAHFVKFRPQPQLFRNFPGIGPQQGSRRLHRVRDGRIRFLPDQSGHFSQAGMEVRGLSAGAERPEALIPGGQCLVNFGKFRL